MARSSRQQTVGAIVRRELGAYFSGPVAYVVGALFNAVAALLFFSVFFLYDRAELRRFFELLPILFAVAIPVLAMRQIVGERQSGMYEVLLTLPIRPTDLVVGKFLALWLTAVLVLVPSVVFAVIVYVIGPLDIGATVAGYVGSLLLAGALSGVAIMASTLSRSVAVAFGIALVISVALASLEAFAPLLPGSIGSAFVNLSTAHQMADFSRGIIGAGSTLYFLSVASIGVAIARHTIRTRR
jgi:gliding motility-associated transport system permease protein